MLYNLSKNIVEALFGKEDINKEIYIYGFELLFSSLIGTILLIGIGIVLNVLTESIIFIISFSLFRVFSGGFHSNSFILCNLITVLNFVIIVLIYRCFYNVLLLPIIFVTILVLSIVIALLFAPLDNPNHPIDARYYIKYKTRCCDNMDAISLLLVL